MQLQNHHSSLPPPVQNPSLQHADHFPPGIRLRGAPGSSGKRRRGRARGGTGSRGPRRSLQPVATRPLSGRPRAAAALHLGRPEFRKPPRGGPVFGDAFRPGSLRSPLCLHDRGCVPPARTVLAWAVSLRSVRGETHAMHLRRGEYGEPTVRSIKR